MAVIHDMMPAFELFQPSSVDDALALLDRHGSDALVMGGGLDSFDWLKDRIRKPRVLVGLDGYEQLAIYKPEAGERPLGAGSRCGHFVRAAPPP